MNCQELQDAMMKQYLLSIFEKQNGNLLTWRNLNEAAENYFNNPPPEPKASFVPPTASKGAPKTTADQKVIFKIYAGTNPSMDIDGISKLCEDLGIEIEDPIVLYLAYQAESKVLGEFTEDEFCWILTANRVNSVSDLKKMIPSLRSVFSNKD